MATFPIQYAERLPSGRATAAPITADVGAPYRALAQVGGAIFEVGQKIQRAEDAVELSTLKRNSEELWNAAYNTMMTENDPQNRAKVYEKAKQDMNAIQAKSNRVQQQFQIHLDNALPQYDRWTSDLDRSMRIKSAKDELEMNAMYYLENNNLEGYGDLLKQGLDTGLMTNVEYDFRKKNAITDAKFAQTRILLNSNPFMAKKILESMPDLTGEQLDQKDKLVRKADQRANEIGDQSHQEYWQFLQAGQFEELENRLNDPSNPLPAEGDGGKNWWYNLAKKRREDLAQTDLQEQSKIADQIIFNPSGISIQEIRNKAGIGIHGGLSMDKITEYEQKYQLAIDPKSPLNAPVARGYFNQLKQAQSNRAFSVNPKTNQERYGQSLDVLSDYFVQFREANKRDPSEEEAQSFFNSVVSGYRGADAPFTDAHIYQTEGALEAGGYRDIYNVRIRFRNAEEAIEYILTRLGPDWETLAPRASEIIQRKWGYKPAKKTIPILPTKSGFETGQQRRHSNGGLYERDEKGNWNLISEVK